ncbi:MAG TPA: quinoprotein dehydrogenase-associated SoxYZ-like carrier [Azospirillum sp.]
MRRLFVAGLLGAAFLAPGPASAQAVAGDPLASVMWSTVHATVLGGGPVVFDDARVRVFTPQRVEDNHRVPVSVQVEGLADVREVVVLADHNPIPGALRYAPAGRAAPFLELSMKLNEATPIRAAVKTGDGVWHVGGLRVDAAGGGCAAPRPATASAEWQDNLNRVHGRAWRLPGGGVRLEVRIVHPMDTGLVENIPTFHVEALSVTQDGRTLATLEPTAATAENPVFALDLPGASASGDIVVTGRDTDGNDIRARIPAPDAVYGLLAGRRS